MDQFTRGELTFDVIDAGPADGPVVVLLHGFPQFNTSWSAVIVSGVGLASQPARARHFQSGRVLVLSLPGFLT